MEAMDRLMAAIQALAYDVAQDNLTREDLKTDVFAVREWAKTLQTELKEAERDASDNTEPR